MSMLYSKLITIEVPFILGNKSVDTVATCVKISKTVIIEAGEKEQSQELRIIGKKKGEFIYLKIPI
jgi:hypothetical protein